MGSRTFLLLVLVLLILTDHSQGVPETHEGSLMVKMLADASAVGEAVTRPNPISLPEQVQQLCKCKGRKRKVEGAHCVCQKPTRRKPRIWKKMCQKTKSKDLNCSWFSKQRGGNGRIKSPSVPM